MLCQCYKMSHFVLFARGPNLPFNLRSLNHLHHSNTSLYLTHFVLSPIISDISIHLLDAAGYKKRSCAHERSDYIVYEVSEFHLLLIACRGSKKEVFILVIPVIQSTGTLDDVKRIEIKTEDE